MEGSSNGLHFAGLVHLSSFIAFGLHFAGLVHLSSERNVSIRGASCACIWGLTSIAIVCLVLLDSEH